MDKFIVFRKTDNCISGCIADTPEEAIAWAKQLKNWEISRPYSISIPENAFDPMVDGVLALREADDVGKIAAAVGGEA